MSLFKIIAWIQPCESNEQDQETKFIWAKILFFIECLYINIRDTMILSIGE